MNHHNRQGNMLLAFAAGAVAWALFGEKFKRKLAKNEELEELKSEAVRKFEYAKDYSQDAYDRVAEEVARNYGKLKGISENELVDLINDLKTHWKRIKRAWN